MERNEAKEILCEQLKLLAEVSKKEANKKIGRRPEVLSKLTDSMLALVTRLFFQRLFNLLRMFSQKSLTCLATN